MGLHRLLMGLVHVFGLGLRIRLRAQHELLGLEESSQRHEAGRRGLVLRALLLAVKRGIGRLERGLALLVGHVGIRLRLLGRSLKLGEVRALGGFAFLFQMMGIANGQSRLVRRFLGLGIGSDRGQGGALEAIHHGRREGRGGQKRPMMHNLLSRMHARLRRNHDRHHWDRRHRCDWCRPRRWLLDLRKWRFRTPYEWDQNKDPYSRIR